MLRNDLYCVEWGVKLYSLTHSTRVVVGVHGRRDITVSCRPHEVKRPKHLLPWTGQEARDMTLLLCDYHRFMYGCAICSLNQIVLSYNLNIACGYVIIIIFYPRYQCSRGRFEKISENEKAGYV